MSKSTFVFWIVFVGAAALPLIAAFLCLIVLLAQILLVLVRTAAKLSSGSNLLPAPQNITPVFSVHVAIHNEPPALVQKTLSALARQTYPQARVEILVIDNNTVDPALWRPVAAECRLLGKRFRFFHENNVIGAKAGALNIALGHTRADATHIITIDADYVVHPDFLVQAARALQRTGADYVQFPQAYQRPDHIAKGVDIELEDYFTSDAQMGNEAEAVLLTGTLCVISKAALIRVNGWSGLTTTEDAELGVRLCKTGFAGRYIPLILGQGLLPLTLGDLSRQRYRWTKGNFRTLTHHLPSLLFRAAPLRASQRAAIIAQLGAWFNFSLIPASCLLSETLLSVDKTNLTTIASLSILIGLTDIIARLVFRSVNAPPNLVMALSAIASRLALAPAAARATMDACLPGVDRFAVTRKSLPSRVGRSDGSLDHLVLCALAISAFWSAAPFSLSQFALAALALPFPAGLWVTAELSRYRSFLQQTNLYEVHL